MSTSTGIYLLLFLGMLCIAFVVLATEYWGRHE